MNRRKGLIGLMLAGAVLAFSALVLVRPAAGETIAIIGTGNVASALGPGFAMQGYDIVYGSRDPDRDSVRALVARTGGNASATGQARATERADIVVLAVPGGVVEEVVANLGDLSGKIVLDPTNPVGPGEDGYLAHLVETSNAELIQSLAPDAFVVKAFNTLNYRTMIDPESSGGPVSIPIVGNNANAKAIVAELVSGMGLEPIDLGPVRYAHVLEGMLVIWANARRAGTPYEYYLRRRTD
jgi:predicted dinucleotide-binding enzyme